MSKLFAVLILSVVAFGQQITMNMPSTGTLDGRMEKTSRNLERLDGFFIVEYAYNSSFATVPATDPPGEPHYTAQITVYRVENGKRQQIGRPFAGQYTVKGCFEDKPETLVDYALKHKDDPPPKESVGGNVMTVPGVTSDSVLISNGTGSGPTWKSVGMSDSIAEMVNVIKLVRLCGRIEGMMDALDKLGRQSGADQAKALRKDAGCHDVDELLKSLGGGK